MEVFLYNSNVCRLCGEENDNGSHLYSTEENNQSLSEIINSYLPLKVSDDGHLPRTICPGCTIQLEATVEFLNLIINGQKVIRELYEREKEYSRSILKSTEEETNIITENIVYEVNTSNGVYQVEHPISLQVAGLEKPKRKRGRPPKKSKTPEELAAEAAAKERQKNKVTHDKLDSSCGKRRRKTPTRFKEVVQGAELERMLKEEGVTDGEESDGERRGRAQPAAASSREPEVIGHLEASGELVLFVKGKGRGRPKGRMRQTREQCVICGAEFSCVGRYMSHVAQHGPVRYRCECGEQFLARVQHADHQRDTGHEGLTVIPCPEDVEANKGKADTKEPDKSLESVGVEVVAEVEHLATTELPDLGSAVSLPDLGPAGSLPDLGPAESLPDLGPTSLPELGATESPAARPLEEGANVEASPAAAPGAKPKLKCNHCDKLFSNKQSKSLHIKAVHLGEKPYTCGECGAAFAYPRSLALHSATHRRRRPGARGYACDLCGKVLNHPSSVVYHRQAVHAAEQYVCGACGKRFRHKQLLQRHQLVHSQARPFACKICSATFKTKANLLNHQMLHYGVKKFSCEMCKHRFAHKTSLTLHMRWHSGVKPYTCGVCDKSFSQKGNLSEHERIHTGERPYACAHCPRRFTTSSQHRLHTRRHFRPRTKARREGPHRCGVCGWLGTSRGALAQHVRAAGHATAATKANAKQQESLLVSDGRGSLALAAPPSPPSLVLAAPAGEGEGEGDERVIYVAYDVDGADSPNYHILDPEQVTHSEYIGHLEQDVALEEEALYGGASLLAAEPAPAPLAAHLPVTDEQGNPLHFTMQDGTRLAITSADGKSLQVITEDGQTIPVEINGFTEEDELDPDTVVHQLDIQKDPGDGSPVAQYFTLV